MRALALAAPLVLASCVTFKYERHQVEERVPAAAIDELEIGTSTIGEALARLGAPLYVWEGAADEVVLAYGSENRREVGFSVSIPLFDQGNASFDYDDASSRLEGFVLVFDAQSRLTIVRAGLLHELGRSVRRRPGSDE